MRRRFRSFGSHLDPQARLQRRKRWTLLSVVFLTAIISGYIARYAFAPWPPLLIVRHIRLLVVPID